MKIVSNNIQLDLDNIIDDAKKRKFLATVGERAKEMIYDETLKGHFANGGPFQYRNKKYEAKKRHAGRFRGHVDFFGFSKPNTINTMITMMGIQGDRFTIALSGDSADKTLKWRGRYNWFSFGGTRKEKVEKIAQEVHAGFSWGGQ